ncbi:MAG: hypothetical protein KBD56_00810 [Candidatus Eisenbacteria bacterium]|nr:hypothetical protein [Candidatus Eisenbacteria bacterium]
MRDTLFAVYRHRSSAIHRAQAMVKLGLTIAFIIAIVLLPRAPISSASPHSAIIRNDQAANTWMVFAAAAALLAILAVWSRVPLHHLGKRLLVVEPFALGIALLALLQPNGLRIAAVMLTKSTLCLFAMVLLSSTTRFSDLLRSLIALRMPGLLVTTLTLMHRYLFVLFEEAARLKRARKSRTMGVPSSMSMPPSVQAPSPVGSPSPMGAPSPMGSPSSNGVCLTLPGARTLDQSVRARRNDWRASAAIAAQLFVRASDRAERVYFAMAARGWKT